MTDRTTLADLWRSPSPDLAPAPLDADPFTDESALEEAQVLDVRFDAVNGIVGVLLEMRLAGMYDEGNAALLTARGVESLTVSADVVGHRLVREVSAVVTERVAGRVRLGLHVTASSALSVVADEVDFWLLEVDGIGEAPPDYGDPDESAVQAGLPQWTSTGQVLQGGRLSGAS